MYKYLVTIHKNDSEFVFKRITDSVEMGKTVIENALHCFLYNIPKEKKPYWIDSSGIFDNVECGFDENNNPVKNLFDAVILGRIQSVIYTSDDDNEE